MTGKIEQAWLEVERDNAGFCCADHRAAYRAMFYAGAIQAAHALVGFDPRRPNVTIEIDVEALGHTCFELLAEFRKAETDNAIREAAESGAPHH